MSRDALRENMAEIEREPDASPAKWRARAQAALAFLAHTVGRLRSPPSRAELGELRDEPVAYTYS